MQCEKCRDLWCSLYTKGSEMILQTVVRRDKSRYLCCSLHTTAARWSSRQSYGASRAEFCGVVYTQQHEMILQTVVRREKSRDLWCSLHCNSSEMILQIVVRREKNRDLWCSLKSNQNQIKSLLLSHHHSTSALVSEILMSVLQTVQKNNRQFTYGQTVQKKQQQQFTYGQTVQKKKTTTAIYIWTDSAKKTTAIYIWTVHIYRLYRRQCAKYTYMHSVRLVYYRDILNYQRHIIHRMGTSTLCTVSIHNVVYT